MIFQLSPLAIQSQKDTASDFKMTTFCLPNNIQSLFSSTNTHKKDKDDMISIQCPCSFKLLTKLYKVKGNIQPNRMEGRRNIELRYTKRGRKLWFLTTNLSLQEQLKYFYQNENMQDCSTIRHSARKTM